MEWQTTQPSLLVRIRDGSDAAAWREFDHRYGELIARYARGRGLQPADAEDVRQMVMINLSKAMPRFEYSPQKGRFRYYLGRVVRNAIANWASRPNRASGSLDVYEADLAVNLRPTGASDSAEPVDELWEQEWVRHHYRLAMQTVRLLHDPQSVEMFDRLLEGESVAEVAVAFRTTTQAVHKVKQRIRDRLTELIARQIREEEEGLPSG